MPEERDYPDELLRRAESMETITAQLAMHQLEATDTMILALLRLAQEINKFARLVVE